MPGATADEVRELITAELSKLADIDPDKMTPEATLADLDIDSLDLVELAQIIEERYDVTLERDDFKDITTVNDAMEVIVERCTSVVAA
jgi:acyl carrier protein